MSKKGKKGKNEVFEFQVISIWVKSGCCVGAALFCVTMMF
jgi:hypothetical protein